ncbi:MAG: RDD family protein, partial [Melioribacteraceae bacterium]
QCIILYGGVSLIMNILVPNINHCGQKDFSFEVRHKAYARPLPPIEEKMTDIESASQTKRFLNWIIDGLVIAIICLILFVLIGTLLISSDLLDSLKVEKKYDLSFIIFIVIFFYYLISESILNTTVGKLITRTSLTQLNGDKVRFSQILIRTFCRFIPFEQFSFLTKNPYGWHDSISETRVVNKK